MRRGRVTGWSPVAVAAGALLTATSAGAQTTVLSPTSPDVQPVQFPIIEWDLPPNADVEPSAVVVDTQGDDINRVWFVTKNGAPARVYRFDPAKSLLRGQATWMSWDLSEVNGPGFAGGIRRIRASNDRRFVWVRTGTALQRFDVQNCGSGTCERIVWKDQATPWVSDVAVDDRNNVFTATTPVLPDPNNTGVVSPNLTQSYIQLVKPVNIPALGQTLTINVTRWTVGGGAGFCATNQSPSADPCIGGIAVHPSSRNLVYFSEPGGVDSTGKTFGNDIAELNVITGLVRRWPLVALGADIQQPRQLYFAHSTKIWVVCGSGHLVSLNPNNNQMTRHTIPDVSLNDPWGVAPDDDVVGYTAAGDTVNKVGMLHPKGQPLVVNPNSVTITPIQDPVDVVGEQATPINGFAQPVRKVVYGRITRQPDGIYAEAFVGPPGLNDSTSPSGITPNHGKAQGTFFYTVALNGKGTNRLGFARLHPRDKINFPRDDDDPDDGFTGTDNADHTHHHSRPDDEDNDGLADPQDQKTAQENVQGGYDMSLASGQSTDYTVTTTPTSLALVAVAECDDPLATMGVEVYNAQGLFVSGSGPTPGLVAVATVPFPTAGTYTVRIRNYGSGPLIHRPKLIVREPALP